MAFYCFNVNPAILLLQAAVPSTSTLTAFPDVPFKGLTKCRFTLPLAGI